MTNGDTTNKPEDEVLEPQIETLSGELAMSAIDRAQVDVQIATAKQYPRTVSSALNNALTLATEDEAIAQSMFYALPRSGKQIEGPSARLAEVMVYAWGNIRAEADIIAEDRTHVTAMGTCMDLERNIAVRVRVKRRITDRNGRRFNADMIGVTSNAAASIALRNAVFKVIPQVYVNRIYAAARSASIGDLGSIATKRTNAVAWFAKIGIVEADLLNMIDCKAVIDIGAEELIKLNGIKTALSDNETTVAELLSRNRPPSDGAASLNDAVNGTDAPPVSAARMKQIEKKSKTQLKSIMSQLENKTAADVGEFEKEYAPIILDLMPEHRQSVQDRIDEIKRDD